MVAGAGEAAQPEAVEFEDPFHVGEGDLDFLAFVPGAFEGRRLGQGADAIADRLVDIAGKPAMRRVRTALRLQGAAIAIGFSGAIEPCSTVMHAPRGLQRLGAGTDINVVLPVIGKVTA